MNKAVFDLCGELEGISANLEDVLNVLLIAEERLWSLRAAIEARSRNSGELYKGSFDQLHSLLNLAAGRFASELSTMEAAIQRGYETQGKSTTAHGSP